MKLFYAMSWPRLIGVIVKILEEQLALYSAPMKKSCPERDTSRKSQVLPAITPWRRPQSFPGNMGPIPPWVFAITR
jgi:hypothetical protein